MMCRTEAPGYWSHLVESDCGFLLLCSTAVVHTDRRKEDRTWIPGNHRLIALGANAVGLSRSWRDQNHGSLWSRKANAVGSGVGYSRSVALGAGMRRGFVPVVRQLRGRSPAAGMRGCRSRHPPTRRLHRERLVSEADGHFHISGSSLTGRVARLQTLFAVTVPRGA